MSIVWAGIGARKTPEDVCLDMITLARKFSEKRYWLRTGAARGADQAWALGNIARTILYLPWESYENEWRSTYAGVFRIGCNHPSQKAIEIASTIHPNWSACNSGVRALHGRNVHIILGKDLVSPVKFVVYWAMEDASGNVSGGTGLGVNLARKNNITCWNLRNPTHRALLINTPSVAFSD